MRPPQATPDKDTFPPLQTRLTKEAPTGKKSRLHGILQLQCQLLLVKKLIIFVLPLVLKFCDFRGLRINHLLGGLLCLTYPPGCVLAAGMRHGAHEVRHLFPVISKPPLDSAAQPVFAACFFDPNRGRAIPALAALAMNLEAFAAVARRKHCREKFPNFAPLLQPPQHPFPSGGQNPEVLSRLRVAGVLVWMRLTRCAPVGALHLGGPTSWRRGIKAVHVQS